MGVPRWKETRLRKGNKQLMVGLKWIDMHMLMPRSQGASSPTDLRRISLIWPVSLNQGLRLLARKKE